MALSDSDLSSLSSAPSTDDEAAMAVDEPVGIAKYFKKESETPPPKRAPSPPHEYVLADNPNIAFIVMFRARFHEVFPRGLPHYGPQDIERGAVESPPGDYIERLLCALLGLVLNRKKDVEYGRHQSPDPVRNPRNHYTRPLEEAIQTHQSQWPKAWEGKNPLHGGHSFATMSPEERLQLLRALILWSLSSSDAVQTKIKESYKQSRHDDDLNQPLSVQNWGRDSLKRRYWLIEGQDDTHFRLYRESNPALKHNTWWSIAGSIPELQAVADKLEEERGTNSKKLSERIRNAVPRFEASEEKRRRRDYRLARKAAFARPEPGFSMYEGRTRGKKLKYTYSDEEDIFSDGLPSTRRSTRNVSSAATPADPARTRFTASGRQIRSRAGGLYGESLLTGQREDSDEEETGRPQRTRVSTHPNGYSGYDLDDLEDESEAQSSKSNSENEWLGGGDEDNDFEGDDEGEEDVSGDESIVNGEPPSLVVQLRYRKGNALSSPSVLVDEPPPVQDTQMKEAGETGAPAGSSTRLQPTSPSSGAPNFMVSRPPETIQQAPAVTARPTSFAQTPQQASQPAPIMAAPTSASVSYPQETAHQGSMAAPAMPPPPVHPVTATPEVSRGNQAMESNGVTRPAPEMSQMQAPFTQGWRPAS